MGAPPPEPPAGASDDATTLARCPVCRARLSGATLCPRCGAELGSVAAVVRGASVAEGRAVRHLAEGRVAAAAEALAEARALSRSPFGEVLKGFLATLEREER